MRDKILIVLFSVLSFTIGYSISNFTYADNCKDLPAYHIFHLNKIIECLEQNNDNQNIEIDNLNIRLTNTNDIIFSEIERLDRKIDNITGTIPK